MNFRHLLFLISIISLFNCNPGISDMEKSEMDQIIYRFSDSSTPPRYHRSYTISITPKEVKCTVNSYGTELANETYPFDENRFKALVDQTSMLGGPINKVARGATGTKGYGFSLMKGGKEFYKTYWDSMQDVSKGKRAFIELVKAQIPNLSDLLARELKEDNGG